MYELVIVGPHNVGKTNLYNRILGNSFEESYISTVALDMCSFDNIHVTDTSGKQMFRNIVSVCLNKADCILLVYDATSKESFKDIKKWYDTLDKTKDIVIVSTKNDLDKVVPSEDGLQFSSSLELPFFEVSSKTDLGIPELVKFITLKNPHKQDSITITDMVYNLYTSCW